MPQLRLCPGCGTVAPAGLSAAVLESLICTAIRNPKVKRYIIHLDVRGDVVHLVLRIPPEFNRLLECLYRETVAGRLGS